MSSSHRHIAAMGDKAGLHNMRKALIYQKNIEKFIAKDIKRSIKSDPAATASNLTAIVKEIQTTLALAKKLTHARCQSVLTALCDDQRYRPTLASLGIHANAQKMTKGERLAKKTSAYAKLYAIAFAADHHAKAITLAQVKVWNRSSDRTRDAVVNASVIQNEQSHDDQSFLSNNVATSGAHAMAGEDFGLQTSKDFGKFLVNNNSLRDQSFDSSQLLSDHATFTETYRDISIDDSQVSDHSSVKRSKFKRFFSGIWSRIKPGASNTHMAATAGKSKTALGKLWGKLRKSKKISIDGATEMTLLKKMDAHGVNGNLPTVIQSGGRSNVKLDAARFSADQQDKSVSSDTHLFDVAKSDYRQNSDRISDKAGDSLQNNNT